MKEANLEDSLFSLRHLRLMFFKLQIQKIFVEGVLDVERDIIFQINLISLYNKPISKPTNIR